MITGSPASRYCGEFNQVLRGDAVEAALLQATVDEDRGLLVKRRAAVSRIDQNVGVEKRRGHSALNLCRRGPSGSAGPAALRRRHRMDRESLWSASDAPRASPDEAVPPSSCTRRS